MVSRLAWTIINWIGRVPLLRRFASRLAINKLAYATSPRPRPLSMSGDYTSWVSVTDRRFTGRHLPPSGASERELPTMADVKELFRRDKEISSTDTSVLFMFFAQWFTDSFLRTNRNDRRQNTSNQEIDLCQVYGLSEEQTRMLRSLHDGRLKSQQINGQEYPAYYFQPRAPNGALVVKPEFGQLHDEKFITETILEDASEEHKDAFFAVGLEHGNSTIGSVILDVIFLREHNRIAGILKEQCPQWDSPESSEALDERLFQTTRNILTVLLLKLVVEEYIRHITPFDFPVEMVPFMADGERWNRSNWIAIEFNLLYRWHSLIPDSVGTGPDQLQTTDLRNNNPLVLRRGIEDLITQFSQGRAAKIGLLNTPPSLLDSERPEYPSVEDRAISLMREARLCSFNDYREQFGLSRMTSFEQLTNDMKLRRRLEALYNHDIEQLEWYVGIFAEEYPANYMMGSLLTRMVGYDAFTQALTNPLLGRNVYSEGTFSRPGMEILQQTSSLQQIVARNSKSSDRVYASFKCQR